MDERAVENDLQSVEDMDGTSTSRGHDEEPGQENLPDSNGNFVLMEEGDCRCFKLLLGVPIKPVDHVKSCPYQYRDQLSAF